MEDLILHNGNLTILTTFSHEGEIDRTELLKLVGSDVVVEHWNKPIQIEQHEFVGVVSAGTEKITCSVDLFTDVFVSGVSILRAEFKVRESMLFSDLLVALHSNTIYIEGVDFNTFSAKKVAEIRQKLSPGFRGTYFVNMKRFTLLELKEYTPKLDQKELKEKYGEIVTRFLSGETSLRRLHGREITEKLKNDISYYDEDLYLVSPEGVLIIGCDDYLKELRELIELTLSLLMLFQVYDWRIDTEIGSAFTAIKSIRRSRFYLLGQAPGKLESALIKVNEIELAILDDIEDLMNPHKVTQDWYYQSAYERMLNLLKVGEFENIVHHKINTLHNLYSTATELTSTRMALIVEVLIVILILFEIIKSFF